MPPVLEKKLQRSAINELQQQHVAYISLTRRAVGALAAVVGLLAASAAVFAVRRQHSPPILSLTSRFASPCSNFSS
eukprot:m.364746 g.364746  ORF g.364746 m.364746 type:complete len:76 (+) comp56042_c0_seq24:112-339(+)